MHKRFGNNPKEIGKTKVEVEYKTHYLPSIFIEKVWIKMPAKVSPSLARKSKILHRCIMFCLMVSLTITTPGAVHVPR